MNEPHETRCDKCDARVRVPHRAERTYSAGADAPVGICNSDFPMPQPCCTNALEGVFLHTRASGENIGKGGVLIQQEAGGAAEVKRPLRD